MATTTQQQAPIDVVLADDHRLVREALRAALAHVPQIHVVAEVGDGEAAVDCVRELRPGVVVLDIAMPGLNGIEAAARIRKACESTRIVALSAYSDKRFVTEMLRAGASAYVSKAAAGTELVGAIRAVAAGGSYLSPDVAGALVAEMRNASGEEGPARLGRREREVLRLIAEGLRSAAIAEQLHIAVATVEAHRRNIMRKLGLHSVAELTKYALREGIVSL
ncbi:response regulator [Caldimonas sp. KR1-144]|uniref:response regulator n=1 Tax=Caldimonas sp. KR1-144 TaxID=3400911 RepID=UPI003BFBF158